MKIVSLVSSFRLDGNTNRIVSLIEKQLLAIGVRENIPIEIERIQLGHKDIMTCRGCRVCFDRGEDKCPLKDDLLSVLNKMNKADGIIAASPVYVEDVNGIMKNWIDRMAFICHRPAFAGKTVYIVTTSGMGTSSHTVNTIKTAFTTWGVKIAGASRFRAGKWMASSEMDTKYAVEIKKAAEQLFRTINDRSYTKPSLYSLIAFKVQQTCWQNATKQQDTVDYIYWQNMGWLEKDCKYYMPNKAGFVKIGFARIIGTIAAAFFI